MEFGKYVEAARFRLRLSREQVAQSMGCTSQYVAAIEMGRAAPPRPRFIQSLAKRLDLPYPELLVRSWWAHRPDGIGRKAALHGLAVIFREGGEA